MSSEGVFYQITNHPHVAEEYFSTDLYKSNPYIRHPDNFFDGQVAISRLLSQEEFLEQCSIIERLSICTSFISYYKKKGTIANWFAFSSSKRGVDPVSLYLNYPELFHHYSDFFIDAWQEYQPRMEQYCLNMSQSIGLSYHTTESIDKDVLERQVREDFFKEIGLLKSANFSISDFSKREIECIDSLLNGNTALITANNLNLSDRTVQHYIENIKNKVGCHSKAELLNCLSEMRKIKLL